MKCQVNFDVFTLFNALQKFVSYMTYSKYSPIFKHSSRYPKTIEFARKCVELCWIMAVHDPPLVFGSLPQRRDQFNADLFREFTKSGTTIDFPVWPVLHLYDKGPVLSKGVVEPIKESLINNRTESRSHGALGRDKYFDTENRHIHRDLGVDESSRPRPVSAIETYTTGTERDKENMFNTLRYRTGDYYDNHLAESDLSLSNLHASRTRPTSSYQQDALLSFNDRSREKYQRPSAH